MHYCGRKYGLNISHALFNGFLCCFQPYHSTPSHSCWRNLCFPRKNTIDGTTHKTAKSNGNEALVFAWEAYTWANAGCCAFALHVLVHFAVAFRFHFVLSSFYSHYFLTGELKKSFSLPPSPVFRLVTKTNIKIRNILW